MRAWLLMGLMAVMGGDATSELVVDVGATSFSTVNGVPVRLRIDPAAVAMPTVASDVAARAGLKAGPFQVSYAVGPVSVEGRTALGRIDLGRGPETRRIAWWDRRRDRSADAVVGPGGVPAPVVRFRLRPTRSGERVATLRMIGQGGLADRWAGLYALATLDGRPIRIRFDPQRPSTATAAVGLALARVHDGVAEGGSFPTEIAFGVERPVRMLRLARPFEVGPLSIDRLLVRVADHGNAAGIATARVPPDPDEVVVTGRRERDRSRDRITIGRDQLDRCSSITFDKRTRQVRLSCV